MAFINKENKVVVNSKLTAIGRQLLAFGNLNFANFAVGDSEVDYRYLTQFDVTKQTLRTLRPADRNPDIRYPILRQSNSTVAKSAISSAFPNEVLIKNSAAERGFFTRSADTNPYALKVTTDFAKQTVILPSSSITGTSTLTLGANFLGDVNDFVFIRFYPTGTVAAPTVTSALDKDAPHAMLWYKVVAVVNATTVTLDRPLPTFNGTSAKGAIAMVYPGGNAINSFYGPDAPQAYFDEASLSFDPLVQATPIDVPVWNLSIVYPDSLPGTSAAFSAANYPSRVYDSVRFYLTGNDFTNPVGIVHYSNFTTMNYYGEALYKDTLVLELPTIMYHSSIDGKLGLKLTCGNTKKVYTGGSQSGFNTAYYDLIDPRNKVVGKVFVDLQIVIIENSEILAAMSYKSNRNWTLPAFSLANASGNGTGATLHIGYRFGSLVPGQDSASYGYKDALHCTNFFSFPGCDALNYFEFKFDASDLQFMKGSGNVAAGKGVGFNASKFILLCQYTNANELPTHDNWIPYDFTYRLDGAAGYINSNIPVEKMTSQIYRIYGDELNDAIQTTIQNGDRAFYYNTNYLNPTETINKLMFGEENFFFGNIKTDIQAIAYRTKFVLRLDAGEYSASQNPTWGAGAPVLISEIAIYDTNGNLVITAKPSEPFEKDASRITFITVDMDF